MDRVTVLNADAHQVLHEVSLRHAVAMLYRDVARVHEAVPGRSFGPYPQPHSLVLVSYVYTKWLHQRSRPASCTLENVLRRDGHACAYCGRPASTRDHVIPRSRGGPTSWLNLVAACAECNGVKRDRTPEQAGMRLRTQPFVPTAAQSWTR
ncbi:MAG: HNH endonuclease [Micropruina sp.]|uniref:HNH endonuclease n=1 Tax=Micropruina sp. TaxID=2737536 RepID=UPI0039E43059